MIDIALFSVNAFQEIGVEAAEGTDGIDDLDAECRGIAGELFQSVPAQ